MVTSYWDSINRPRDYDLQTVLRSKIMKRLSLSHIVALFDHVHDLTSKDHNLYAQSVSCILSANGFSTAIQFFCKLQDTVFTVSDLECSDFTSTVLKSSNVFAIHSAACPTAFKPLNPDRCFQEFYCSPKSAAWSGCLTI